MTRFNRAWMGLVGISEPAQALGKTDFDLQTPELAREFYAEEQKIIATGQPIVDRIEYNPTKDGQPRWLSATKALLLDRHGRATGIVGISRDITARKRAEEELEKSLSLLQATLESTADGILVVDLAGHVTGYNRNFIDMWQMPESIVVSREVERVQAHITHQMKESKVSPAGASASEISYPETEGHDILELRNGKVFERLSHPQRVGDKTVGRVLSFRDITERRQSTQALQEANEKLTRGLNELEQRTHEMALLNDMSDLLQTCLNFDEAFTVISRSGWQLFPGQAGILYIINASRNLVEPVARWGSALPETHAFAASECWALRRGRMHLVEAIAAQVDTGGNQATQTDEPEALLLCDHLHPPWSWVSGRAHLLRLRYNAMDIRADSVATRGDETVVTPQHKAFEKFGGQNESI